MYLGVSRLRISAIGLMSRLHRHRFWNLKNAELIRVQGLEAQCRTLDPVA